MSRRFYPRQKLSRQGAISTTGSHAYRHPENERSRLDGLSISERDTLSNLSIAVTGSLTGSVLEANVVTGGKVAVFTITGPEEFAADTISNAAKLTALIAGMAGSAQIEAALVAGSFALSGGNKVLTLTLPAIGGYVIAADETLSWVFPASAFRLRASASASIPVGVITNQ